MRPPAEKDATTFPSAGDTTTPAITSVNHAPRKRVGSTLRVALAVPRCHHARARQCSAVTEGGCAAIHPYDGPPPTPTPPAGTDHRSSTTPCAVVVRPP